MTQAPAPVAEAERADVLDALRAFALLGILVSHVPDFTGYSFLSAAQRALLDPLGVDPTVSAWLVLIIREKFVSLFSLLFGMGFAIQLDSAVRRRTSFGLRYGRRLAALLVIGAVHAALWYGDILKDYAILGLALLASSRWPVRRVLAAAVLLFAARLAWPFLAYSIAAAVQTPHAAAPDRAFADVALGLSGGLGEFLRHNLELVRLKALQMIYEGRFLTILTMFFVGAVAGRLKVHADLRRHRRLLLWVLAVGGLAGLAADAALVPFAHDTNAFPPTRDWVAFQALVALAAPGLCLAYASGFSLLWLALDGGFLRGLAPIGRMALTSYVSQTILCTVLFTWLGLGAGLGAVGCLAAAVLIFGLQSVLARAWLRRFQFGPLEWLWRCATYGAVIPLRAPTAPAVATAAVSAGSH